MLISTLDSWFCSLRGFIFSVLAREGGWSADGPEVEGHIQASCRPHPLRDCSFPPRLLVACEKVGGIALTPLFGSFRRTLWAVCRWQCDV